MDDQKEAGGDAKVGRGEGTRWGEHVTRQGLLMTLEQSKQCVDVNVDISNHHDHRPPIRKRIPILSAALCMHQVLCIFSGDSNLSGDSNQEYPGLYLLVVQGEGARPERGRCTNNDQFHIHENGSEAPQFWILTSSSPTALT
eukprot:349801-Chlamydomonas_euryale.AAC.34